MAKSFNGSFKLTDTNRYYLPNTNNAFLHIATAYGGVREFMCFVHLTTNKIYIEEITGGHLSFIEDDLLAFELAKFFEYYHVLDTNKHTLPDKWLKIGKKK